MRLWPFGRVALFGDSRKLGRWGEKQAERYLCQRGLFFIARNWRSGRGELDLVMADRGGAIVVVEVKSRTDEEFTSAVTSITTDKKRMLIRTAKRFLNRYKLSGRPLRFDVITVVLGQAGNPQIRHYPNAFTH